MSALHYITLFVVLMALINMAYGFLIPIVLPYPRTFQLIEDESQVFLPHAGEQRFIPIKAHHTI